MRKSITKRAVDALKPGQYIADDALLGFVVRRLASGRLSYGLRYTRDGKRRWIGIGVGLTPHDARIAATRLAGEVAAEADPLPEREARRIETLAARTVDDVLDGFLERVKVKQLRSAAEMESLLRRHVRPKLGDRHINDVKRSEVVALLDGIAAMPSARSSDGKSRRVADKVLGVLRSAFNWHQGRDDEFASPIVKGMARTTLKELSRDRILDDGEIVTVWQALDRCGPPAYVRLVRALLLSGARLNEMARLRWTEIVGDVAVVPASRTKAKVDDAKPITANLAALIGERAGEAGDFVFSTDHGASPFSGFSKAKKRLDAEVAKLRTTAELPPMPPWRLHDLRRTARTLLSRAKVDPDVAERVLGHAIPGIRRVYDQHPFIAEKRDALERLAALVWAIVEPPPANVVSMRKSEAA